MPTGNRSTDQATDAVTALRRLKGRWAIAANLDDSNDLTNGACSSLWVGVAGDVNCVLVGQTSVILFKNAPAGKFDLEVVRVHSTSTTATDIVAVYTSDPT